MRKILFLAVLAMLLNPSPAPAQDELWVTLDCKKEFRWEVARNRIRALVRTTDPTVEKQRVRMYYRCVSDRETSRSLRRVAERSWDWRHQYPQVYRILYLRYYSYTGAHLASIAWCESRNDPRAIGGGGAYRGMYQFSFSTWGVVGGRGDPAAAHPWEQTYRAAKLLVLYGAGHWPVCG